MRDITFKIFLSSNLFKMKLIKQVAAVDVSQNELVCSFGKVDICLNEELTEYVCTENSVSGFKKFKSWVNSIEVKGCPLEIVMEATGVYHEKFAHWLISNGYNVVIVMPNKIANYMKTLNLKTVNDKTSSEVICKFGLKHKLDYWTPSEPIFKKLQQLTRERSQIIDERTIVSNQIHAENKQFEPNKQSLKRANTRLKLLKKQELEIDKEIKNLVKSDEKLKIRVNRITTISGVGLTTAATALAETNGFEYIRNKRQLTSYAGLDVVEKQSGTSIRKKTKISKKGNVYLRKCLYFPAITGVRCNAAWRDLYERIYNKSGIKMKGYVAVQRKILELIYILDKTGQDFDMDYNQKVKTQQKVESLESSIS